MMLDTWEGIAIIAGGMATVGTAVVVAVRHMLRAEFVPHAQHDALRAEVGALKQRLGALPNEHDLDGLTGRLGRVETGVAVVQTTVEGVNTGLKRVERIMDQMLQRMLEKDVK